MFSVGKLSGGCRGQRNRAFAGLQCSDRLALKLLCLLIATVFIEHLSCVRHQGKTGEANPHPQPWLLCISLFSQVGETDFITQSLNEWGRRHSVRKRAPESRDQRSLT